MRQCPKGIEKQRRRESTKGFPINWQGVLSGGEGVGKAMRLNALAWLAVWGWLAGLDSVRLTDENIHGARNFGLPSNDVVLSGNGTGQSGGGS